VGAIGGECQAGFYCPESSSKQQPCDPGEAQCCSSCGFVHFSIFNAVIYEDNKVVAAASEPKRLRAFHVIFLFLTYMRAFVAFC